MGLVNDDQKIIREVIQQRTWRFPRFSKSQVSRIVLDTGTKTGLPHHLHIKIRTLRNSLCLQKLVIGLKISHLLLQLFQNILRRSHHLLFWHYIMGRREDCHVAKLRLYLSRQRVDLRNSIHLIAKEFNAIRLASGIRRKDLQHISAHTEGSSFEIHLISRILNIDQLVDHFVSILFHSRSQRNHHFFIVDRAAQTVNTGNRRHDDHVISF